MAQHMIKNPFFARASTYEVMAKAFKEGGVFENLDRIAYIYVLDTGILYHVSMDKVIRPVVGDNPEYVQRLDELPPTAEADEGLLYVVDNVVYSFYNGEYHPTYEAIVGRLDDLETGFAELTADYEQFKTDVEGEISSFKTEIEGEMDSLKTEVEGEMDSLKTEVEGEMSSLRTDLEGEMSSLRTDLESEIDTFETTVNNEVTSLSNSVINLDGEVTTLQGNVASLTTGMASLDRSVTALGRQIQGKADKATTLSGYGITDAYTKSETKALLGNTGGETVTEYVNNTVSDAMGLTEV